MIMATSKEIEYLLEKFDYNSFIILGFYDKSIKRKDYNSQIKRICEYFGINNIFQYDTIGIETKNFINPELKTFSKN